MSPIRRIVRRGRARRRIGIVLAVTALAAGAGLVFGVENSPDADARPINPYVPCPQWQEMHPGWPCWGNFPEIEEPTLPAPPPGAPGPSVPTPPSSGPTTPPSTSQAPPPAAALTPPPPEPAPDPCKAIVPVPGYVPPALPGHPPNPPCSGGERQRPPTPRELIEPFVQPACGGVLSSEEIHEIVTEILGPLERENPDSALVQSVINSANINNDCKFGGRAGTKQRVWDEERVDWYYAFRDRNINRDRTRKRCEMKDTSKDCEGVVAVCLPKRGQEDRTPIQQKNLQEQSNKYIDAANEIIHTTGTPLVRQELDELTERLADRARVLQRSNDRSTYYPPQVDADKYPSGAIDAGHLPDTVWTRIPDPPPRYWAPMDMSLNRSIGSQAKTYPVNYKARAFVPGVWLGGACVPRPDPYVLGEAPPTITSY